MSTLETNIGRKGYKLSQLCRAADFHPSTVHYYVRIGLLHVPRKTGLGLYLYDDDHLEKLKRIRTLRKRENLSLARIKEMLRQDEEPRMEDRRHPVHVSKATPIQPAGPTVIQLTQKSEETREKILDAATRLFARKGYEGTAVSDITEAVGISKGSFYLYFKDKREVFAGCIGRLADRLERETDSAQSSREGNFVAAHIKRMVACFEACPSFVGMLHLVRFASTGEDAGLARIATEALARIENPMRRDLRRAIAAGVVREVDEECFVSVLVGTAESIGFRRMSGRACNVPSSMERCVDMIARGVIPRTGGAPRPKDPQRCSGEITDVRGDRVKVREIYFGGKPHLAGRIGEGEVQLDTGRIAYILFDHTSPACAGKVTMADGEQAGVELDGNMIVSAASSVGLYTIPLRSVRSISFE
jgi:AcrR family transcriptional regulator